MSLIAALAAPPSLAARAARLAQLELSYQFHESFTHPGDEDEILGEPPGDGARTESSKPLRALPAHLAHLCRRALLSPAEEQHRFRRMNYAKYQADLLRRTLNLKQPQPDRLERIDQLLSLALGDRNEIVSANIRLVISLAKRFVGTGRTFDELLSEGIETLLRAVEKFDYSRGFRFSTYATTALRRSLQRSLQNASKDRERLLLGKEQILSQAPDRQSTADISGDDDSARQGKLLVRLIRRLDPREQHILTRRYGLNAKGDCQTLQSLAGELGVCKERVRQLETRARNKLRALSKQATARRRKPASA